MRLDDRVDLVPERAPLDDAGADISCARPQVFGRLIALTGSQAVVQFSADQSLRCENAGEVTIGSLLGIKTGKSLAIGALCELSPKEFRFGRLRQGRDRAHRSARGNLNRRHRPPELPARDRVLPATRQCGGAGRPR